MSDLKINELNGLGTERFVDELDDVYEHSPWVAERTAPERPFGSIDELHDAMSSVVDDASRDRKLELLRAHPDLGDQTGITDSSKQEQVSAGLDRLTPDLYETFQRLNERYREKFDFPFVMAVEGKSPSAIRKAMETRTENTASEEFETALEEVHTIARLRIESRVASE